MKFTTLDLMALVAVGVAFGLSIVAIVLAIAQWGHAPL